MMYLWILLLLINLQRIEGRTLNSSVLSAWPYEKIHQAAVEDQIRLYRPAQKSLDTREPVRSLDGLFDFCFDKLNKGFAQQWYNGSLKEKCPKSDFYRMPVPSAFNDIVSDRDARNYIGWFWYQTSFWHSEDYGDDNWYIQFESVNYLALVWLERIDTKGDELANETRIHFLGSHVGGHLPFIFNLTSLERKPESRYRLSVAVSNQLTADTIPSGQLIDLSEQVGYYFEKFEPDFDFFHFAGILGSVRTFYLAPTHFTTVEQVFVREGKILKFEVCIQEKFSSLRPYYLKTTLSTTQHDPPLFQRTEEWPNTTCTWVEVVWVGKRGIAWDSFDGEEGYFSKSLWATFQLQEDVDLLANPTVIDRYSLKVVFKRPGAEPKRLQGFGMHQEQYFSGRTMSQAAIMKDIYLLKQMGANVIRTSHYPYSSEYLDACDENGISVILECPAVGLNSFSTYKLALHKQILLEMMQRDSHHPSIIMWSVANEPQSQKEEAEPYFRSLLDYARTDLSRYTVEANRPLTAAIAQPHDIDKVAKYLEVIMVNRYYGWYDYTGVIQAICRPLVKSLSGWSGLHPGKRLIVSEFGADAVSGLHQWTAGVYSEEYQLELVWEYEKCFDEVMANKSASGIDLWGSMIWNFADFSTHDSLARVGGNRKGLFSRAREPKLAAHTVQEIYQRR